MTTRIEPRQPSLDKIAASFAAGLRTAPAYSLDLSKTPIKLDQNEMPWDFPVALKREILARVEARPWNRYPSPFSPELTAAIADYVGVPAAAVFTGPGSNYLISLLLDALGRSRRGALRIARPSFSLFESHCRFTGISYEPWDLGPEFAYQPEALADLPADSVVLFASPNNPTGSRFSTAQLDALLSTHSSSLFIADEAYYEFGNDDYVSLLAKHDNLIILRTFSKTMGAAGVRLGYVIAAPRFIAELVKLRLPYLLNHFSVESVLTILGSPSTLASCRQQVQQIVSERNQLFVALQPLAAAQGFALYNTAANFLFAKWTNTEAMQAFYKRLLGAGILVRDVSKGPGLSGCLRFSVGTVQENAAFVAAVQ